MDKNTKHLAERIESQVAKKGTLFLSFEYNGKKRNITVGAKINKAFEKRGHELKGVGVTWGQTEGPRGCIQTKDGRYYVRGFENVRPEGSSESTAQFKVYALDKVEGEISGIE